MKMILFFIATLTCCSCSKKLITPICITGEKDLIPEGIAVDKDKIFVSSVLKNKIIQVDLRNNAVVDFISTGEYGFGSGIGVFCKNNLLFALTNSLSPSLFIFDIKERRLVKTYQLDDDDQHLWNDLTVDDLNHVYITDSKQHRIYKINYPGDQIEMFFSDPTIKFPNGITLSDDDQKLFIASSEFGIRILDIPSKKVLNNFSADTKGIDGLKYLNGNLYAVKNGDRNIKKHGLFQIQLNKELSSIKKVKPVLIGHNLMNVPTTFDIGGSFIYLLANSQLDNLNQETMKIIDPKDLSDTYILKIKMK